MLNGILTPSEQIIFWALASATMTVVMIVKLGRNRGGSCGLPLAYILNLMAMHVGALVYLVRGYSHSTSPYLASQQFTESTVLLGLEATGIGMMAFMLGCFNASPLIPSLRLQTNQVFPIKTTIYTLLGISFATLFIPLVITVPVALSAIMSAFRSGALTACAIGFSVYIFNRRYIWASRYLILSSILPIFYLLAWGFASYGLIFSLTFFAFCISCFNVGYKKILASLPVTALVLYVASSVYVLYMLNRHDLREVLWSAAGVSERVSIVGSIGQKLKPFDPWDDSHLHMINMRLNHNIFIGKVIENVESKNVELQHGTTLAMAVVAWIPRFVWHDKPATGGNELLAEYTGLKFSRTTTMATGQIFELFINFGRIGIFIGMFIFGIVVRYFDVRCRQSLLEKNYGKFIKYHLVGMALILPSGLIFFMVTAVAASWVGGDAIERFIVARSKSLMDELRVKRARTASSL
jgi:hypothetical protein